MLTRSLCSLTLAAVTAAVLFGSANQVHAQNRVIDQWHSGSAHYDPFNDHVYVDRERVRVRESALDPHRSHIDPGSERYVDRYFRDEYGRLTREYGWTWTSHGEPHGKLTRERVSHHPAGCQTGGGVTHRDRDTVIYSQPRRGGVTERNRDTVIYSQPRSGGVTERNRDTVIFSQPGSNNNHNNSNNNRNQSRTNTAARQISSQVLNSLFGN